MHHDLMSSCSSPAETMTSSGCGCGGGVVFDGASAAYKRVLGIVIALNVLGFGVVGIGSWLANSAALAANTLDFAADAATYALSLWAIGRSVEVRSGAALFKGASLGAMAVGILGFAIWRTLSGAEPDGGAISGLGLFGVSANLVAAALLVRFRDGDANVRSVWLCTRNDLVQCLAVTVTGVAVSLTHSRWPDLIVGALLAAVFLRSAWLIISQACRERREAQLGVIPREYITHSNPPAGRV
jgi:Co/Zn/Cd efflux system component